MQLCHFSLRNSTVVVLREGLPCVYICLIGLETAWMSLPLSIFEDTHRFSKLQVSAGHHKAQTKSNPPF